MRLYIWVLSTVLFLIFSSRIQSQTVADSLHFLPDCGFTATSGREGLRVGAVILNLETGTGCAENLDERFHVASVPKIFVAGAYYDWLAQGFVNASTEIPFTESYLMGGTNACLTRNQVGQRFSNRQLVAIMINCSDNAATWMLMDSLGWLQVANYVDNLDIEGIGPVVPYSEVDRLKLAFLDETWQDVPRGMASRFYRRGWVDGLSQYFDPVPTRPTRPQYGSINEQYFATYDTNTITPHALAQYFLRLRDAMFGSTHEALVANWLFDVMLYTQRQFSVQALPGTVLVGSKNGFDRGLLAEANVIFASAESRVPSGLVIVFTQYESLSGRNGQLPGPFGGDLNDYLSELSPLIQAWLYPNYTPPPVELSLNLSSVVVQTQDNILQCWNPYFVSGFDEARVNALESCLSSFPSVDNIAVDDNLAMGLVLRGLNAADTRLVFVYTAPDGRQFSYQADREFQDQSGIYWFHPIDSAGEWQVDIYLNLQHVYSTRILAR